MKTFIQTGIAGVYYTAGELTRQGLIATVTLSNCENYDILAINPESKKQYAIQVKTTWETSRWKLTVKAESVFSKNHYYVLVVLFEDDKKKPEFYIIQSKELAKKIKSGHKRWKNTPGKKGQEHKDNPIRIFMDKDKVYFEKWECFK